MNPLEQFGAYEFNDRVMSERLPRETYESLKRTTEQGRSLDPAVADIVAGAMKEWAMEMGATHYTHWFQPMTGYTAEKHDAFLGISHGGTMLTEFSGKALIKGENDASSFPSGGLRATFEARGYTAWDPSSYAFVKDGVLYIPTAFCAYGGQALDKKTPLLRSMQALNKQALRILRLFGNTTALRVTPTVGAEQEYFLVDKETYRRRPDLVTTGRTLFGARPPKGQELDDHYCGVIKPRVQAFMKELNSELWKLGVLAKTEHNEAAPAQHELAPLFTTVNLAADQNQLTMDMMKKIADRHGMVCLLHEKPFLGVNGSGKHINYSLSTNEGVNLLDPGDTPGENAQFLLFLTAMIALVDEYQDLLRLTVASAGNDHRLGASEAPPAIISIFLGDDLSELIQSIVNQSPYQGTGETNIRLGVHILPKFRRDATDRNRTSPFAFTGNKFEFRSPGSSQSISGPCVALNTALADVLMKMADELEGAEDFTSAVNTLIRRTLKEHQRILFSGNGYDDAWKKEAAERGLSNLQTTVDALPSYLSDKTVSLFERQNVYTREEVQSRHDIKLENYVNVIDIEALSTIDIARHLVLPAAIRASKLTAEEMLLKKQVMPALIPEAEKALLRTLNDQMNSLNRSTELLERTLEKLSNRWTLEERARYVCNSVLPAMKEIRSAADALEAVVPKDLWPMPTYEDLLTSV